MHDEHRTRSNHATYFDEYRDAFAPLTSRPVDEAIRRVRADAWDEGYNANTHEHMRQREDPTYPLHRRNPYRTEEDQ